MMKIQKTMLSMFLLCSTMQSAQNENNPSPKNIEHRLSDADILLSNSDNADNVSQKTKNQITGLQQSIDEQALQNKILSLSARYNKLLQDPKNDRDILKMIQGNTIKFNPVQDALKEMNDTAKLLEVIQRYYASSQYQYSDQYSSGALDKDNKELQYLLDLRDVMIKTHSLPDKNDKAYQDEMKFLVQQCRYSITMNNMFNDTLLAVEDRIVVLMRSRARDSDRALARKNAAIKQSAVPVQETVNQVAGTNQLLTPDQNFKINSGLYAMSGIGTKKRPTLKQQILPANFSVKPTVDTDQTRDSSIEELD